MEEPNELKELNQTPSTEDYEAIKAELEAERAKAQELVDQATKDLKTTIATYEQELESKTQELNKLKELNELNQQDLEGAKAAYAYAVDDFKKLAAASNPLIPAEVIYGTTIEEVKASLDRANTLVGRVKQSLAEQTSQTSIPAGAPARTAPSTEGLSTKEKINLGLEQARRRKD